MRHSHWLALGLVVVVGCGAAPGEQLDANEERNVTTDVSEIELATAASLAAKPTLVANSAVLAASATLAAAVKDPAQDACANYNDYTATLASRVIDCAGTIGPDQFDASGKTLKRSEKFKQCTSNEGSIADIDALLSMQDERRANPALAVRCILGRWQAWYKTFKASGIESCPVWKKTGKIYNEANYDNVKRITETLPKLPDRGGQAKPLNLHENYAFKVGYENSAVPKACETPGRCAAACAGGFPGFVVKVGTSEVIGDPTYWLLSKVFGGTNPFREPYYHAMSYSGDLPGEIYGHRNRVGESCSRYMASDATHQPSVLVEDCLIAGDAATCLSRCRNPYDSSAL